MSTSIDFREIPLFTYFGKEARAALGNVFSRIVAQQGERLLTFGQQVPGIFIIVEGNVDITLPDFQGRLVTLSRGQCFGEMSLIEGGSPASADVTVSSAEAKILHCSKADFQTIIDTLPGTSDAFYRGSAVLLSARLRETDHRLNTELSIGQNMFNQILRDYDLDSYLSQTKTDIERTGDRVVQKLSQVMPLFDDLTRQNPQTAASVATIQQKLEELFLLDCQEFDRISQQIHLIQQHFENIRRIAKGGSPVALRGDVNLFKAKG